MIKNYLRSEAKECLLKNSKEGMMAQDLQSPLTGILEEDKVYIDFGEHEGKSVLEIADTLPDFYEYLVDQKTVGSCTIRRTKDKLYRLYLTPTRL